MKTIKTFVVVLIVIGISGCNKGAESEVNKTIRDSENAIAKGEHKVNKSRRGREDDIAKIAFDAVVARFRDNPDLLEADVWRDEGKWHVTVYQDPSMPCAHYFFVLDDDGRVEDFKFIPGM